MWCIRIYKMHSIGTAIVGQERGTYHVEFARKEGCATVLCFALVSRMTLKEMALSVERLLDWFGRVNVTLTTIHDGYIAQT
jgi:hypothetical protein